MGIRKRKVKADFIEDYLGTEALKGTYEIREKVAKMIEAERSWVQAQKTKQENEMRKKILEKALLNKEMMDKYAETFDKCMVVLQYTMMPDAYEFLMNMRNSDPEAFMTVFKMLVPMDQFHQIDAYLERLKLNGWKPPKNRIQLVSVVKMYRKIRGVKNQIMVERDGVREPIFGRKVA